MLRGCNPHSLFIFQDEREKKVGERKREGEKKKKRACGMPRRTIQCGALRAPRNARIGVLSCGHPYKAVLEHGSGAERGPGSMFGLWEGAAAGLGGPRTT